MLVWNKEGGLVRCRGVGPRWWLRRGQQEADPKDEETGLPQTRRWRSDDITYRIGK
jgi:hypothetical protein